MIFNTDEINKILSDLSKINLSVDFEIRCLNIAKSLTNSALISVIQEMEQNPELSENEKFRKQLEIFINVRDEKKLL